MDNFNKPLSTEKLFKILIVEDDNGSIEYLREQIGEILPNNNITVAKKSGEFIEEYKSNIPDLVVSEVTIDGTNLVELLKNAAKPLVPIPLVIFTSSTNEEKAIELLTAGASDYVFKEYPKRFRNAVLKALTEKEQFLEFYYMEKDLQQYEHYLEKYMDYEANIPGMTFQFILHPDGRNSYTYIGSASKRIFNLEQHDIVREPSLLYNLFEPEDVNQLSESLRLSAITLSPFQQEVRHIKNGKTYWYQFNAKPKKQINGDVIWNGILLDTTELKKLKEELELEKRFTDELSNSIKNQGVNDNNIKNTGSNSQEDIEIGLSALSNAVFDQFLFKILMDHSPDAIYFKDTGSKFIKINKGYVKKIKAASEKDILGKTDFDIFNFEHANDARNDELRIIQTGDALINKIEKEILFSGNTAWVSTTKIPLKNNEGEIIGTFGMSRDITEQKLVEEALELEKNLMRGLIDSLPDKIYVKDLSGKFLLNNKAQLNALGVKDQEETIGKTEFDFMDKTIAQKNREDDLHVIDSGRPMYSRQEQLDNASGKVGWYMSTKVPLKNNNGEAIGLVGICHDITESKTTQEMLLASETRLRNLITTTSAVLYTMRITNNDFILTWIGDNIKQFGYKPDEIKSNNFWDKVIHPDDYDYFISSKKSLLNNERLVLEYRIRKINDEYIWVRDEAVVIYDHFGKASEIFGSWLDITERMQSEEALLNIESQLNNALKIAKLAYWEYDVPNDIFTFNDQFYSILQTTADREGGYNMSSAKYTERFVYKDDINIVGLEVKKAIETQDPHFNSKVEHRIVYADGEIGFISVQFNVVKDDFGKTIKTYGANQDLTERKKAEEALSASEYFLRKSQSIAQIGSYKFDIKNGTWDSSETLDEIFGIDKNYLKNINGFFKFVHPSHKTEIYNHIKENVILNKNRFEKEFKIARNNDGRERWILAVGDLEFDKDNNPVALIGTIQDITDRIIRDQEKQELEIQLRQRNQELEKTLADIRFMQGTLVQSEKMASLGQLSAGIAHEINNPLTFVSSNFNRLKEYFQDTIELLQKWQSIKSLTPGNGSLNQKLLEIDAFTEQIDMNFILEDFDRMMISIQDGTQRIKKIIEGMRGFSHISDDALSEADINLAIEETITIVWNEIKYKATLDKNFGKIPLVKCNIGEIKQVIVNLLINASHAIKEKGTIYISTICNKEFIYIEIKDTGCGISKENLKRIFDPFFTTKPVGKGTGLGLWISSSIIEKHKGSITAQSEPGTGTTFTIRLPISKEDVNNVNKGAINL